MVAEFTPNFSAAPNLPPQNVEAEEALLGAILLDCETIGRVVNRLTPEAFYIQAHGIIYEAAVAVHELGQRVDLMTVTTYLYDRKRLGKVGGQGRLADLVEQTVSSLNADRYADLVLDKWLRRQLIEIGNRIVQSGFETFRQLDEVFSEASDRITNLMASPAITGEDPERTAYNRLILEIQQIELGCSDPGERLWKLQELAKQSGRSTKQLEALYFMSLLKEENESLLTWKELSDRYGDQVREWFLHGFLPKGVVVALHAKGGVGKTRLVYDLLHTLLTGGSWNGFPTTGARRAIVIQTDESAGDMLDALRRRGFDESMDNVRYKTRWTFEHLPQLVKECEEFKPEVIVMDSITSMSRHSLFSENDVQYARPVLKLKDLAQMLGCSIILIHHSSKTGDARGTSAIFNSVSEVWKLERDAEDKSPDSTKRLLTIEKSRSRRPTAYKLNFEPEQGSWSLLGEAGVDENNPDLSTKERIVQFLLKKLGDHFESEEIANEIQGSPPRVRLCCARLATDGIISQAKGSRGRGKVAKFFIGTKNDRPTEKMIAPHPENDRPHPDHLTDRHQSGGGDHFISLIPQGIERENDRGSEKNTQDEQEKNRKINDRAIILVEETLEASPSKGNKMIALNDRLNDRKMIAPPPDHLTKEQPGETIQRAYPATFVEYQEPTAPFNPGDRVWFDDPDDRIPGDYVVQNCSHTHARLEGVEELVNVAWLVLVEAASGSTESTEPYREDK